MDKESQLLISRLSDLANESLYHGYCTFSDFLNLNEQSVFLENRDQLPRVPYALYGGYESAERRMVKFYQDYCQDTPYPVVCVKIQALSEKFSDTFSHRDFLGAILNLGIDRSKTGDILIKDNAGYLLTTESMGRFICDNLEKVKHTKVRTTLTDIPEDIFVPNFKTKQGTVSSIRIDSLISLAFNLSRTSAVKYISQGLVFVNGRQITSNSAVPKDNDIISVRTMGRFKLETTDLKSKKDKFVVKVHIYN